MFETKPNFFEQIASVTYDALHSDEEKSRLALEIKNVILTEATKGHTEAKFNLGNRKYITDDEIVDIAHLVDEGFQFNIELDITSKEYPTLSLNIVWACAPTNKTDINGNNLRGR